MKLENFSNYEIYPEEGKIWSYKSNRFVGYQNPKGYWQVGLTDDEGVQHHFYLQRVIWLTVNGQIPESMDVNHIDEDPSNCAICNLNLMTRKENINWASRNARVAEKLRGRPNEKLRGRPNPKVGERLRGLLTNRKDLSKPVERCDLQGNVLERYASTMEAERQGYNHSVVCLCCNNSYGKLRNVYKGNLFRYVI